MNPTKIVHPDLRPCKHHRDNTVATGEQTGESRISSSFRRYASGSLGVASICVSLCERAMEPASEPPNRSSTNGSGGSRCARAYTSYLRTRENVRFLCMCMRMLVWVSDRVSVCGCVYRLARACVCVCLWGTDRVSVCVNVRVYATRFAISAETSDRLLHARWISAVRRVHYRGVLRQPPPNVRQPSAQPKR